MGLGVGGSQAEEEAVRAELGEVGQGLSRRLSVYL